MEEIRREVIDIMGGLGLPAGWEESQGLMENRVLDSFSLISLVTDLDQSFGITITADKLVPENFNSVDAIAEMVSGILDED